MDRLASQIIAEIIREEMELSETAVWVGELNYRIPDNEDVMASVGMSDAVPFSSQRFLETRDTPAPNSVYEINRVQLRENIQVDFFGRTVDALTRRWEVIAALNSIRSEQLQEQNSFKIFKLPNSFINTSAVEGGSQLARYTLNFACHVWYKKEKLLSSDGNQFYDEFSTRVDDEETIGTDTGIIEFTIDENTEPP